MSNTLDSHHLWPGSPGLTLAPRHMHPTTTTVLVISTEQLLKISQHTTLVNPLLPVYEGVVGEQGVHPVADHYQLEVPLMTVQLSDHSIQCISCKGKPLYSNINNFCKRSPSRSFIPELQVCVTSERLASNLLFDCLKF